MNQPTEQNAHAAHKPSVFRSLKVGVGTYVAVVMRNYWQSLLETVTDAVRNRDGEKAPKGSNTTEKLQHGMGEVKQGLGEAVTEAKNHGKDFRKKLFDPLAIASAVGTTWFHYQNARNAYKASQERQSLHETSQQAEQQHRNEQKSAEQEHRSQLEDNMRTMVKEELARHGVIPADTPFAEKHGRKPAASHQKREEQRPLAEAGIGPSRG